MSDHSDALISAVQQLATTDPAKQEEAAQEVARIAAEENDSDARDYAIDRIHRLCDDITKTEASDMLDELSTRATTDAIEHRHIQKVKAPTSAEEATYRFYVSVQSPIHGTVDGVIELPTTDLMKRTAFETQVTEIADQVMSMSGKEEYIQYINGVLQNTPIEVVEPVGLSNEHQLVQDLFETIDTLQITTKWVEFADAQESFGYYDPGDRTLILSNKLIRDLKRKVDGEVNFERAHNILRDPWLARNSDNTSRDGSGRVVRCWFFDARAIADYPGIDIAARADIDASEYERVIDPDAGPTDNDVDVDLDVDGDDDSFGI